MNTLKIVLLVSFLLVLIALFLKVVPGRSKLVVRHSGPHFPTVSGYNLERKEYQFPPDFLGRYNLVIIAFLREQQEVVNTWLPHAGQLEGQYPGFYYYELPTIRNMSLLSRTMLNEGMRAGIPDPLSRQRTVTLYLDKQAFKSALGITTEQQIHLFLVDRQGEILWRTTGEYTDKKLNDLIHVIE